MALLWRRLRLCRGRDDVHDAHLITDTAPAPPIQAETASPLVVPPAKASCDKLVDVFCERGVGVREVSDSATSSRGETLVAAARGAAECPICLSELAERAVYATECGHHFHHCCIGDWMRCGRRGAASCPVCRSSISAKPVRELLWESATLALATDEDIKANLPELQTVIQSVDEKNRNLGSKNVFGNDGEEIQYFVTGRIRTLFESNQSYYYIVFAWQDKIYEASVDTSDSVAFYMSLKVKIGPNVEFKIEYVDH